MSTNHAILPHKYRHIMDTTFTMMSLFRYYHRHSDY